MPFDTDYGALPLLTNSKGQFANDLTQPALAVFSPGCTDSLTKAPVQYFTTGRLRPQRNVTITPASSLVEPLRRALCTASNDCRSPDDAALVGELYGRFGFPPAAGVDYETGQGVIAGSKHGVSVYILNLRLATVLTAAAAAVNSLCPGFNASTNTYAQLAVQAAVIDVLSAKANASEWRAALSELPSVSDVMARAFAKLEAPEAGMRTCATLTQGERSTLFATLAQVRRGPV